METPVLEEALGEETSLGTTMCAANRSDGSSDRSYEFLPAGAGLSNCDPSRNAWGLADGNVSTAYQHTNHYADKYA
ncbi:MAG TPA: hypothetical protein VJA25_07660 [Dehalococcoidia bacterium]|nr:hypothetical protein [Anaerolineales bacterium]HLE04382.1 hypothetical protein [Anaerolineales bacterium]HLE81153.1 hypothetical protein [Dehalococcoidia bacterium]